MSADERKDGGAESLRNTEGNRGEAAVPSWVPNAWEMRIVGMQSWESIGAAVGHKWDTVKRWVTSYSQMLGEVADNEDVIHARAEYVASLQRIKRQAEQIVLESENAFAKTGALNTRLRACEKLAAAKGVVTERKSEDVNMRGKVGVALVPAFGEQDPLNHIPPEADDDGGSGMADDPEALVK